MPTDTPASRPRSAPHQRLLDRAHHMVPSPPPGNALTDLEAGYTLDDVVERRGLPLASVIGIRSFYDQLERMARVCDGTACHFHGGDMLHAKLSELGPVGGVRCLGHCHNAPAFRSGDNVYARPPHMSVQAWVDEWGEGPSPMIDIENAPCVLLAPEAIALRHVHGTRRSDPFAEYALPGAEAITAAIELAGLRGRARTGVLAAEQWRVARETAADTRYVVANGDEGDPGAYIDRVLLEQAPHSILAGMIACGRAIGARQGYVFIRGEYPLAPKRMRMAIEEARARGVLGIGFDVEVLTGAGSYVSGDANALLRSIEGLRGEPAPEPPSAAERGLWGKPTVVHDVETFSLIPWVVREQRTSETKTVCISGAVARPCMAEIALGMPLRDVLMRAAGGPREGSTWRMALVGGPTGRVLPEAAFDTLLTDDALPGLGHGGIVVLDETVSPRALAEHLFAFAAAESCGACAPCRAGTAVLRQVRERAVMERLLLTITEGSLCGFGQRLTRPLHDLLNVYGDKVLR